METAFLNQVYHGIFFRLTVLTVEDCLTVTPSFLLLNRGFPFMTMAHLSVNSKQGNALAKK